MKKLVEVICEEMNIHLEETTKDHLAEKSTIDIDNKVKFGADYGRVDKLTLVFLKHETLERLEMFNEKAVKIKEIDERIDISTIVSFLETISRDNSWIISKLTAWIYA